MTRPKLPIEKKKVPLQITVDPVVADDAKASGNASQWMNEVCLKYLDGLQKRSKKK